MFSLSRNYQKLKKKKINKIFIFFRVVNEQDVLEGVSNNFYPSFNS